MMLLFYGMRSLVLVTMTKENRVVDKFVNIYSRIKGRRTQCGKSNQYTPVKLASHRPVS